jgi:DNA segregation ATPase FtsK/SpoIIIE, S-DNA-T family
MPAARKPARKPAKKAAKRPARRAPRRTARGPGLPVLEQRHMDLLGLALVCFGVFLAFPLYLEFDGGQVGAWVVEGCRYLVGEVAYAAPVAFVVAGALMVLRPVLASVRPYRSGGLCLLLASTLAVAAHTLGLGPGVATVPWKPMLFEFRGGILGDALYHVAHGAFGTFGTHLIVVFSFLAGVLLVTGASIAGTIRATSSAAADTTRALRARRPASPPAVCPEPDWDEPGVTRSRAVSAEPAPVDAFADAGEPSPGDPGAHADEVGASADPDPIAHDPGEAETDAFAALERH